MNLWSARFSSEINPLVNDFNSSIHVDSRMYKQDIQGSIAHARMLGAQGIISKEDSEALIEGLHEILSQIEEGTLSFDEHDEDIHMAIEGLLTEKLGDVGKRLHTARSRNDQVALDLRMYSKERSQDVMRALKGLVTTLVKLAKEHGDTIMPAYTHLQKAQPISFAHHLLAYASMFIRDLERMDQACERMNVSPLGSGALATTTYPIDRNMVAEELGFNGITINSLDGVSDRDFAIEIANNIALIMMHLSRFSEEIILWCSSEFKYLKLDDAYATGSSIMPQKKNPDIAELVRGKSGRCFGNLISLLTMMKGLPLAYNKDMQEDKEALFDSFDTAELCLVIFDEMLASSDVQKDVMKKAAQSGFINATDCADYLVKKGLPFRDAYSIVGSLVKYLELHDKVFEELSLEEFQVFSPLFEQDVFSAIQLENCVENRKVMGGPAKSSVEKQIELIEEILDGYYD
ncbi:MAG: argininosuccinate lyase [Coriobacteriia bacterium]|nr:argininosuccinate lyase [Coriobacteriia bacterium]